MIQCYITNMDNTFSEWDFAFSQNKNAETNLVKIYPQKTKQAIVGFGGALTEASAYVFAHMPASQQDKFLQLCFSQQGNAYNFCRTHIQSCDFSLGSYTYLKKKRDKNLESFSIDHDRELLIPFIKCAQAANNNMAFIASPWTPPAFMKTTHTLALGGRLKPEYYDMWAAMVVRYLEEYAHEGIKIAYITVQNEPMARQTWESCLFTGTEEAQLAAQHLRPALDAAGFQDLKILVWDHNKDRVVERLDETFSSAEAAQAVAGVALHWYTGDHFEALAETVRTYPEKEFIFTEGCVEYSRYSEASQEQKAEHYAHDMIGNFNAGVSGFIDWNILLDEKGGPNHVGNYCEAPLMFDRSTEELIVNRSFYYIGHFSRFVKQGAKCCLTSRFTDKVECVGFVNPNGQRVLVVLNKRDDGQAFTLCEGYSVKDIYLGPHSIATLCWDESDLK